MTVRKEIVARLKRGPSLGETKAMLESGEFEGQPLRVSVDDRCLPYLDHTIAGWVDGPPGSSVAAVVSGKDPADGVWRRFTITRKGPWQYELGAFPTPFYNADSPLSPGIPPSATRKRG